MEKMKNSILKARRLLTLAIVAWSLAPLLADVTGTILGTVTDTTGAVVPGAKVVLRNPNMGLIREATTDSNGSYEFLAVPAADQYSVEVEARNLQRSTQQGVKLLVNQRFRADFELKVGSLAEAVTIIADAAQVESVSTQLGDVIEEHKMADLPLNGRSFLDLLGLQAGVVPISTTKGAQPVSGNLGAGRLSVNGQREDANLYMINGAAAEEVHANGASVVPTLDSIQEFRLLTNSFDAEYGLFSGGILNAITKSGTNQIHGTAFEFLRNDKLDARNFFDQDQTDPVTGRDLPGTARGAFQRNTFGGVVGGPILKNRLFFFGDYQGTRERRGLSTGVVLVPSLAERGGDFSDVTQTGFSALTGFVRGDNSAGAMPAVLSQRLGYTVNPGEPYWVPGCNSASAARIGMCVFPNQIIPQSAWSPAAKGLLGFIPSPNGYNSSGQPFFSSNGLKTSTNDDKLAPRIDFLNQLTGNWSFYYHYDNSQVLDPYGGGSLPGFLSSSPFRTQGFVMSNTRIFGPSAVNELRIDFVRLAYGGAIPLQGKGTLGSFGFVEGGLGMIPNDPSVQGVPRVYLNSLGLNFGAVVGGHIYQDSYHLNDGFSKIVGKHTLKFGASVGLEQYNNLGAGTPNGTFNFNGGETGNDFADFLVGAPDGFVQDAVSDLAARTRSAGIYGQDSYRVRPNLTLNYGLRWELGYPWYEAQGKIQAFVPGLQSTRFPDSPTGWVFPGDAGIPKTLAPARYDNFAPRLGIAYSPGPTSGLLNKILGGPGKSSIRAGAGIFYTSFSSKWQTYEGGDPPFGNYYSSPALVYLEEPYKSRVSNNNPGQRFPYVAPPITGSPISFAPFLPINGVAYQTDNVTPYAEDFNLTIQREIAKSTVLTLGYVGTRGHHLFSQIEFNPGNAAECLQIRKLFSAAGQPGSGCGPSGEDTIYTLNGQTFNGTRPYSVTSGRYLSQGSLDFTDSTYEETIGNSNYNALQVTVNKTVGAFRFLGAYTWSKALDDSSDFADLINPFNHELSKSPSGFDMTHNFVVSYSYDLPLHRLTSAHSGMAYKALAGWQLSGITRFSTGVPVRLYETGDLSLCGCDGLGNQAVDLPNYNGQPVQFFNPRTTPNFQYFSTDIFSAEQLGVAGNANRRLFHGPGLNNWDVSLFKTTHFTERLSMDIRAEFFNVFNHAQFMNPVGNFSAGNFGDITAARDPRIGQVAIKIHF